MLTEHKNRVKRVLERLCRVGLHPDINRCEFHVQEAKYIGMVITVDDLRMDTEDVDYLRLADT
jgi:hypothetical protein